MESLSPTSPCALSFTELDQLWKTMKSISDGCRHCFWFVVKLSNTHNTCIHSHFQKILANSFFLYLPSMTIGFPKRKALKKPFVTELFQLVAKNTLSESTSLGCLISQNKPKLTELFRHRWDINETWMRHCFLYETENRLIVRLRRFFWWEIMSEYVLN